METGSCLRIQFPAAPLSARFVTPLCPDHGELRAYLGSTPRDVERRLLAVLAVDVEGYCRLVEVDELGTYKRIRDLRRQVLKPAIAAHRGRMLSFCGDGGLVVFSSAISAVRCAVIIQDMMELFNEGVSAGRHVRLRIGVSIDDAIVSDGEIYGRGVNIASRLEAKAEPGGILISGAVFDQVEDRLPVRCQALGRRRLRKYSKRVRVYSVATSENQASSQEREPQGPVATLPAFARSVYGGAG